MTALFVADQVYLKSISSTPSERGVEKERQKDVNKCRYSKKKRRINREKWKDKDTNLEYV